MSSAKVCEILAEVVRAYHPNAQIVSVPVADGGEGTVDCFLAAAGGKKCLERVQGPYGQPVEGFYGLLCGGETAVVEMAAAAGLPLAGQNKHPGKTTTYGAGQLLLAACKSGAKRVILGLGGSATNDGGCGAAAACGVRFLRQGGKAFVPVGGTLHEIAHIDTAGLVPEVKSAIITGMCDIDNPLCGPEGAAAVFGPQKGADAETVKLLDEGLCHLAAVIERDLGRKILEVPGAGAAGGMAGGLLAFLNAELRMGIDAMLEAVNFTRLLKDADLVITGEGKLDGQSLRGKAVLGVARAAQKQNVPVVALAGVLGDGAGEIYAQGVNAVFCTNRAGLPFEALQGRAEEDLRQTAQDLMRFYSLAKGIEAAQLL